MFNFIVISPAETGHCRSALSREWQHVKLSNVSLGTRPRYSLVVDEDVKKQTKQTNTSLSLPRFSCAMVQLQLCKQIAISSRLQLCYGTIPTNQTIRYLLQGSAVLWYNLLRNGEPDTRLVHAGCPVAIGDKWSKRLKHSNILLSVLALSHLANQSTCSPQSRN